MKGLSIPKVFKRSRTPRTKIGKPLEKTGMVSSPTSTSCELSKPQTRFDSPHLHKSSYAPQLANNSFVHIGLSNHQYGVTTSHPSIFVQDRPIINQNCLDYETTPSTQQTSPQRHVFVNHSDIYPQCYHQPSCRHLETKGKFAALGSPRIYNAAKPIITSHGPLSGEHEGEIYSEPGYLDLTIAATGTSESAASLRHNNRNLAMTHLDHVPEDASLHSFSGSIRQDVHGRSRPRRTIVKSPPVFRSDQTRLSHLSSPQHVQDQEEESSKLLESKQKKHQKSRDRIKMVSERLRQEFRAEWDVLYGERLRSAESLIASYTMPYSHPPNSPLSVANNTTLESSRSPEGRCVDPVEPRLPNATAWLAKLRGEADTSDSPNVTSQDAFSADSELEEHHVGVDYLVPAPLRTSHLSLGSSRSRSINEVGVFQATNAWRHKSPISVSPISRIGVARVSNGSTIGRLSLNSPVSYYSNSKDGYISRSPSPLLPPTPLRLPASSPLPSSEAQVNDPSPPWDLKRVRSALKFNRVSLDSIKTSLSGLQPAKSVSTILPRDSISAGGHLEHWSLSNQDPASKHNMYYHQNRSDGPASSRPGYRIKSLLPPPSPPVQPDLDAPPVPKRSPRRAPPPPQLPRTWSNEIAAEVNGELSPAFSSHSKSSPRSSPRFSPQTPRSAKFVDLVEPKTDFRYQYEPVRSIHEYGPFHEIEYRGRSMLYHVDSNGEYSF